MAGSQKLKIEGQKYIPFAGFSAGKAVFSLWLAL